MALTELRIASRRSQLAMVQTNWVKAELEKAHPGLKITVEAMATQGDKILDVALAKIGDKGLFTKELEAQMLVDRADIAVHSLKDLPTNLPEGLMLGCITEREDPADALVVNTKNQAYKLDTLPEGSVVGTSSLRRLAQRRIRRGRLVCRRTGGHRRGRGRAHSRNTPFGCRPGRFRQLRGGGAGAGRGRGANARPGGGLARTMGPVSPMRAIASPLRRQKREDGAGRMASARTRRSVG